MCSEKSDKRTQQQQTMFPIYFWIVRKNNNKRRQEMKSGIHMHMSANIHSFIPVVVADLSLSIPTHCWLCV